MTLSSPGFPAMTELTDWHSHNNGALGAQLRRRYVASIRTSDARIALTIFSPELQGKSLGLAVDIFDDNGKSIEDTGEPGEMVVTRPHVSLPLGFWGDKDNEKYRKTYFSRYPGQKGP